MHFRPRVFPGLAFLSGLAFPERFWFFTLARVSRCKTQNLHQAHAHEPAKNLHQARTHAPAVPMPTHSRARETIDGATSRCLSTGSHPFAAPVSPPTPCLSAASSHPSRLAPFFSACEPVPPSPKGRGRPVPRARFAHFCSLPLIFALFRSLPPPRHARLLTFVATTT